MNTWICGISTYLVGSGKETKTIEKGCSWVNDIPLRHEMWWLPWLTETMRGSRNTAISTGLVTRWTQINKVVRTAQQLPSAYPHTKMIKSGSNSRTKQTKKNGFRTQEGDFLGQENSLWTIQMKSTVRSPETKLSATLCRLYAAGKPPEAEV